MRRARSRRRTARRRPTPPPNSTRGFLTTTEAAKELGVCKATLMAAIARGQIPALRLGRSTLRLHREVLRTLAMKRAEGRTPAA